MKFYSICIIGVFLIASCKNQQKNGSQIKQDIQGMWLLDDSVGNELKYFTLYFNDSICHVFYDQSNLNRYRIVDSILELKITTANSTIGNNVKFRIISSDNKRMELYPLSPNLREYCKNQGIDTLKFDKIKRKNRLVYYTISFGSSGCFGTCPSFDLELNKSGEVVYNGYDFVKKEGHYKAKKDVEFYVVLKDKLTYIDFKKLRKSYEAGWTDDQTIGFVVETKDRTYETSVYGADREPSELRVVFEYIFSNYENLKLVKSNSDIKFKYGGVISRMRVPELEKVIQFIPPVVSEEVN